MKTKKFKLVDKLTDIIWMNHKTKDVFRKADIKYFVNILRKSLQRKEALWDIGSPVKKGYALCARNMLQELNEISEGV